MTVDQTIALVASLCGMLSAVAAFVAAYQNKIQREASYRPELIISQVHFFGGSSSPRLNSIPNWWDEKAVQDRSTEEAVSKREFSVRLSNIGLGTAKNLKVKWSFPFESFAAQINAEAEAVNEPLVLEVNGTAFCVRQEGGLYSVARLPNDFFDEHDYLLPMSLAPNGLQIRLPIPFVEAVSAAVFIRMRTREGIPFPKVPRLHLRIEYADIGGKQFISETLLKLKFIALSSTPCKFMAHIETTSPRAERAARKAAED